MEQQNLLRSKSVTPSPIINTPTKLQPVETNKSLSNPSAITSTKSTIINLKNNINNNNDNDDMNNNIKNGTLSNMTAKLPTMNITEASVAQGAKLPLNENNHHLKDISITSSTIKPVQSKEINNARPTAFSTSSKIESQSKLPLSNALPNSIYNTPNKNNQRGSAHLQTSVFFPALSCVPNLTTNPPLSPSSYTSSSYSTVQTEINKNYIVAPIPTRPEPLLNSVNNDKDDNNKEIDTIVISDDENQEMEGDSDSNDSEDSFKTAIEYSDDENEDQLRFSDRSGTKSGPKSATKEIDDKVKDLLRKKATVLQRIRQLEFIHDQYKSSSTMKRTHKPYLNIINKTIESSSVQPGIQTSSDQNRSNLKRKRGQPPKVDNFNLTSHNIRINNEPNDKPEFISAPIHSPTALNPFLPQQPSIDSPSSSTISPSSSNSLLQTTASNSSLTHPTNIPYTDTTNVSSTEYSPFGMSVDLLPDGNNLSTFIDEFCELVSVRAIDSVTSNGENEFITPERPPPRLKRLFLVNNFTIPLDSIRNNTDIRDTGRLEERENNVYYESNLLWILRDGIDSATYLPSTIRKSLRTEFNLYNSKRLKQDLLLLKNMAHVGIEDYCLESLLERIKHLAISNPKYELLWILYMEVAIYHFGRSPNILEVAMECLNKFEYSLDIYWLLIRSRPEYQTRKDLIYEYLEALSSHRGTLQEYSSAATTELLLRVHRFYGLKEMLVLFLGRNAINNSDGYDLIQRLNFSTFPRSIYLTDSDSYYLWMNVIYYLICGKMLPDSIRGNWCLQWKRSEKRTLLNSQHLFTIDWSSLITTPLSNHEQRMIVGLLLKMVKHFCEKARANESKRPLFMAVWRTLIECQLKLDCYREMGVLILLKRSNSMTIKSLQPEIIDICLELESNVSQENADDLWQTIQKEQLSVKGSTQQKLKRLSQGLFLAFRSAIIMNPTLTTPVDHLMVIAWRVARPLWLIVDNSTANKLTTIQEQQQTETPINTQKCIDAINYLYGIYQSALGLDDAFSVILVPQFDPLDFQKLTFAWINTILITAIRAWLLADITSLKQMLDITIQTCSRCIRSESEVKLIFKYVEECRTITGA
ncbi:unnamed protein product [Cunninghamella echinulata]